MAPFQTSVTLSDDMRDGQEVIEVQILPQVITLLVMSLYMYIVLVIFYPLFVDL